MEEMLVTLPDYPNYTIGSFGNIYSHQTKKPLFTRKQNSGYSLTHLNNNGVRKAFTVHRLVAIAFLPNPENKAFVNHKDGNKENNRLDNLEWCTAKENMVHAVSTGLLNERNKDKSYNKRMKDIGSVYGFENSQNHLMKAEPISFTKGTEVLEFRSKRSAGIFLNVDHKLLTKAIKNGTKIQGYSFKLL